MDAVKKIVLIGPESTGKTTLAKLLADYFGGRFCPEFARQYLLEHGTDYDYNDLLTIAKGQLSLEDEHTQIAASPTRQHPNPYLFLDTDMYVMRVWCEFVFGDCHSYITKQIHERKYDLYLLCKPDLPWVKDELREYPDLESREKLYGIYKDIMESQDVPWVDISGPYDERLAKGIEAVFETIKQVISSPLSLPVV